MLFRSLGGGEGTQAALGKVIGPSFAAAQVPDVIAHLLETYVARRREGELFIDAVERLGLDPFRQAVYGDSNAPRH